MRIMLAGLLCFVLTPVAAEEQGDGELLRANLRQTYPSLAYVERYRSTFPEELQGDEKLWTASSKVPQLQTNSSLVDALIGLHDQHVALAGANAGKTESLGVLFRTATDSSLIVWRVLDPAVSGLSTGDEVVSIDGMPSRHWLNRAAARTFGGNLRSRVAEAALGLGLGTRIAHQTAQLNGAVKLTVKSETDAAREVVLPYLPMSQERALATTKAINRADLPELFEVDGYRVGSVRLGAFAPQYDPLYLAASDAAAKITGTTEDQAMLAGFCAVTREFISKVNELNRQSDLLVVDLRGNFGGFGREARLLAEALTADRLPNSFDVFATGKPGTLRLEKQPDDPSCGEVDSTRPVIVLTDAGTRSAGEFMATWLWASGAIVVGERTIGAGGGRDSNEKGFPLPGLNVAVKMSGNFTFFDSSDTLQNGETSEQELIDLVAQDRFAPSRTRPFAIQSVGLRPDVDSPSTIDDLRDGGLGQVKRAIGILKRRNLLH